MSLPLRRIASFLLMLIAAGVGSNCEAQTPSPAMKVYAYERELVGGIPGGSPGVGSERPQLRRILYLETAPKAEFTVDGIWVGRQFHRVETAIKSAPVHFESPVRLAQEEKNVAVPATANKVTEIVVKEAVPGKAPDEEASRSLADNAAAVQLNYGGKTVLVPIKTFERREPLYLR